jgi:hypothetical protein
LDKEQDAIIWWRNYIGFACATVSVPERKFFFFFSVLVLVRFVIACVVEFAAVTEHTRKKSGVSSARELFGIILPYLKSSSDAYRQTVAMALERANSAVYDVLFDAMKPYQQDYSKKSRMKRKDKNKLRNAISSIFLFSFLSFFCWFASCLFLTWEFNLQSSTVSFLRIQSLEQL